MINNQLNETKIQHYSIQTKFLSVIVFSFSNCIIHFQFFSLLKTTVLIDLTKDNKCGKGSVHMRFGVVFRVYDLSLCKQVCVGSLGRGHDFYMRRIY